MRKNKLHIIYSWLLIICFIAGQYMIYTHQHLLIKDAGKSAYATNDHQQQTLKERCYLCDAMHHQAALMNDNFHFTPLLTSLHFFKACSYNFVSMSLVLAAGRAPPVIS